MQGDQCQPQQHNDQDRKVNQEQHHEPQKCPRCESLNTKFCYYNNYSLSQPRYFCKSCRRYWTQGGTLRNVPIGGGCRKGKRAKDMSSSSSSLSMLIQQHQQSQDHHQRSLMMSSGPSTTLNPMNSSQDYLGNAKYLTSMPFTHNLSHLGSSNQLGSGGVSNLGMLYGFNDISSYGQCQRQDQLFKSNIGLPPLYQSDDYRTILLQPTRSSGAITDWPKRFINKSHASPAATLARQTALCSVNVGNNTSTTSGLAPSLNSVQQPNDLACSFPFSPQGNL